jgi:tRNA threonylcarbamoyladenosine biosynthesis protein TsaB
VLLAIDTASHMVGIGLDDGAQVVAEHVWQSGRYHTVELAPEVARLLHQTGQAASNLEAVAVASGPGSYTGLRIGMALAKGLALARRIPLVGVPTLDILAAGQPPSDAPLMALMAAGRERFAAAWYKWGPRGWRVDGGLENLDWDGLLAKLDPPCQVCGEFSATQRTLLSKIDQVDVASPALCVRRPSLLGQLARRRLKSGRPPDPAKLTPTYLGEVEAPA